MDDLTSPATHRPFTSKRWDRVPFYRWWRRSVVGTVDHPRVMERIIDESGLSARYIFMTMMSAGIAVLGLLLSSPAVVIGAMLISPLMGPILGVGFGLALFDFTELRRATVAFLAGSLAAMLFCALIVLCSPLKATTAEILARTRPNLFDLLVALFAALAGTFAIIRGRGETIVGVAIATALMPPLAVVGYGLATWNVPVLVGSLALFITNFLTIAAAATIMARLYGFGHFLSSQQGWLQTAVLLSAFVVMAVPLGLSLGQIAREALIVNQVRSYLVTHFGPDSRVTQLDVDFARSPWSVRSVVIAPRDKASPPAELKNQLQEQLARPLTIQIDQILIDPAGGAIAERDALERANDAASKGVDRGIEIAGIVAVVAGVKPDNVTLDREHQRVTVPAAALPGATLETYWALEQRASAAAEGWTVSIIPPLAPLPLIRFPDAPAVLDSQAQTAVRLSAWAARRWNLSELAVPGLPESAEPGDSPSLSERRARAIAAILRDRGLGVRAAPATTRAFRLAAPGAEAESQ